MTFHRDFAHRLTYARTHYIIILTHTITFYAGRRTEILFLPPINCFFGLNVCTLLENVCEHTHVRMRAPFGMRTFHTNILLVKECTKNAPRSTHAASNLSSSVAIKRQKQSKIERAAGSRFTSGLLRPEVYKPRRDYHNSFLVLNERKNQHFT